jgi:hypothetical protein
MTKNKRYTISDGEELVKRNFPGVNMKVGLSYKGRLKPIGIKDSFYQDWYGGRGDEGGFASIDIIEDVESPSFALKCCNREIQKNYIKKCEANEQEKKNAYDKL